MITQDPPPDVYEGGCFCGNIRYRVSGRPDAVAVCHCKDCRRSAGAPLVVWALYSQSYLVMIKGTPKTINSSGSVIRSFCPECGTGLFYSNPLTLPGRIDIQAATFDTPEFFIPQAQIQTAERLSWLIRLNELPEYERYPGNI